MRPQPAKPPLRLREHLPNGPADASGAAADPHTGLRANGPSQSAAVPIPGRHTGLSPEDGDPWQQDTVGTGTALLPGQESPCRGQSALSPLLKQN